MKSLILFFLLVAYLNVALALFGNYKKMRKEDFLHREPPIDETVSKADDDTIYEGWVPTRLNQFDRMDNRTYLMRYLMNRDHMVEGGPIFIFVGGEWTISAPTLLRGHMYDMARNLSGLMIYSEHRYYGYSTPTPNLELDNMQWLNIDQALADLAHFIVHIKNQIPEVKNSGVVLVGCSYSGTMVTWFMQKYPHLANGAWSMSAPLLGQVDFIEYKEVVSEAIRNIGDAAASGCSARIEGAFREMERLYDDGEYGELARIFRLCAPLDATNILDVWSLFGDMAGPWSGIAQYASRRGQQIENNCKILTNSTASDIEAYAQWVFDYWRFEEEDCYDNRWSSFLFWFNGTEWTDWVAEQAWRQWLYQTCAEYGWYQSSGSSNILFGSMFPVNVSLQFCMDLYENQ